MKRIFLFLFFISMSLFCDAQDYKYKYFLDEDLSSVNEQIATFIGKGLVENNLFKLDCFNLRTNVLIFSAHFMDSSLATFKGPFKSYYINGIIENEGSYNNNVEQGLWVKKDSVDNIIDSTYYNQGIIEKKIHRSYDSNKNVTFYDVIDSVSKKYFSITYKNDGAIDFIEDLQNDTGTLTTYENGEELVRKVNIKDKIEARYAGGASAYSDYLRKNLKASVPSDNNAPSGAYTVMIKFIVNVDGTLSDFMPETNFGYGMEKEAMRVLKTSPKWQPASFYGKNVKAYRRQPITFVIDNGDKN